MGVRAPDQSRSFSCLRYRQRTPTTATWLNKMFYLFIYYSSNYRDKDASPGHKRKALTQLLFLGLSVPRGPLLPGVPGSPALGREQDLVQWGDGTSASR